MSYVQSSSSASLHMHGLLLYVYIKCVFIYLHKNSIKKKPKLCLVIFLITIGSIIQIRFLKRDKKLRRWAINRGRHKYRQKAK